jgi:LysM repeat protein
VVKSGENLFRIGKAYDVPYQELARINSIQPHQIHVGQRIFIPGATRELPVEIISNLKSTLEGPGIADQREGMRGNDEASSSETPWLVEAMTNLKSTLERPGIADQSEGMRGSDEASSSEKPWLAKPVVSTAERTAPEGLLEELRDGFSARIEILGFGLIQKPVDSPLNPDNIVEIPRYQTEVDLRPDFNLTFRRLELGLKPRFELKWREWDQGRRKGNEGDEETYIHEGFARYRVIDPLIVSYGRENLQWGPSYLFSASNPFNRDNGRNNPKLEVPALDYGRLLWLPTDQWTLSFIANTTKGRQKLIRDFERGYAIKIDYSDAGKYLTFIPSYREDGEFKFGFYGGWTVSDALLLHAEGSFSDHIDETDILVGGSYTFASGPTIVAEYFRNQNGCTRKPFHRCFLPFDTAQAGILEEPLTLQTSLGWARRQAKSPDILFRRNYLLLQYNHTRIRNTINLIVRWIHNIDDHSNRIVNILEYELGEHTRLFAIGNIFPGPKKTEFGSFLNYSGMLGVSFTF